MNQQSARKPRNGIISLKFNDKEYIFWTNAETVLPHIYQYLKQKYPNNFILSEFNYIDFVVLEENLPVEVQSTIILGNSGDEKKTLAHSYFEQIIGKQIRQNIERYGKCWFFFDSEYFRYLRSEGSISRRLDLGWFVDYVYNNLLNVFIIDFNGLISEISYEDLSYLVKCDDEKELVANKINILSEAIRGQGYTSEEIRDYYKTYIRDRSNKQAFVTWLKKKEQPERRKRLGYILFSVTGEFRYLDEFFSREKVDWTHVNSSASFLGLLDYKNNHWSLEDYYDVLKYFPGYKMNRSFWDEIKNKQFEVNEFKKLVCED